MLGKKDGDNKNDLPCKYRLYILLRMIFEWDEKKRLQNLVKHGIDFQEAEELFSSPMVIRVDTRKNYGESRHIGLGLVKCRVIAVAFVPRGEKSELFP